MALMLAMLLQAGIAAGPAVDVGQKAVRLRCSEASSSQVGFGACLQRRAVESAAALSAATTRALARLGRWDEDAPYVAKARAALAASGPAFVRYRQAQCAFAGAMGGGGIGTAHDAWRLACVYELNMRCAAMLDGLVVDLPRK